ncbi:MAG: hypothetical protein ACXVEU_15780 [Nocardioidaceae bacterium]
MRVRRCLSPLARAGTVAVLVLGTAACGSSGVSSGGAAGPSAGPGGPRAAGRQPVTVGSYRAVDPTRLRLTYAIGIARCDGHLLPPQVQESPHAVVVRLTRLAPHVDPHTACPDLARVKTVQVRLRAPLDGRVVRDANQGRTAVPQTPRH